MLLEVSSDAPSTSASSFLCTLSVRVSVRSAVEHVARVHSLRTRLASAVAAATAAADGDGAVNAKRPRNAEALAGANALLSPLSVNRKNVLTAELLEAALTALSEDSGGGAAPSAALLPTAAAAAADAGLYFAGKWLEADKVLNEYVGSNEKSKVKVRFSPGSGASEDAANDGGLASAAGLPPATAPLTAAADASPADGGGAPQLPATATAPPVAPAASSSSSDAAAEASGVSLSSFFKQQQQQPAAAGAMDYAADDCAEAEQDDDMPVLSSAQAAQLLAATDVQAAVRDPRLQEQLRHIDSAPTREGALRRLERSLLDADFDAFTRTALRAIGHAPAGQEGEQRNGAVPA